MKIRYPFWYLTWNSSNWNEKGRFWPTFGQKKRCFACERPEVNFDPHENWKLGPLTSRRDTAWTETEKAAFCRFFIAKGAFLLAPHWMQGKCESPSWHRPSRRGPSNEMRIAAAGPHQDSWASPAAGEKIRQQAGHPPPVPLTLALLNLLKEKV
jgi:hypothetical protein